MKSLHSLSTLLRVILICGVTLGAGTVAADAVPPDPLTETATMLANGDFAAKEAAIERLSAIDDPRVLPMLQAMLAGNLYRNDDGRLLQSTGSDQPVTVTDALSGQQQSDIAGDNLKKISINNKLRGALRSSIAVLSLSHGDAAVRLQAAQDLLERMDDKLVPLLRQQLQTESDTRVRRVLQLALAFGDINANDSQQRLQAIEILADDGQVEARQRLTTLLATGTDGKPLESDAAVLAAARKAVARIDSRAELYGFAETFFFGLSLGSVLLLAAIGLAITFGVMGVINMAHGELMMLGAYTTYVVQLLMPNAIAYSLFVAIPAAFLVSGLTGIAIERGVIRFLYGRPLETLLATFGISLLLQQLVRSVFSPLNRSVATPEWMSGSWQINSMLSITYNRLYILLFALAVFALLVLVLKKTRLGLQVRAVSQNRAMARAMGVRSDWVDALTFGLGSGIAGVAGVALSQLTNVGPNLGQGFIIDSFMVVVFGGVGNLWGTLVGAMTLGVVNKFMEPWSGAVLAKILVLVFIILFIQKRPRGLFPQKGRAVEH